jgi:hypothetical protein
MREPKRQQRHAEYGNGRDNLDERSDGAEIAACAEEQADGHADNKRDDQARADQFEGDGEHARDLACGGEGRHGALAKLQMGNFIEPGEKRVEILPEPMLCVGLRERGDRGSQKERAGKFQNIPPGLPARVCPHAHCRPFGSI